jgi:hypothetical protein
MNCCGARIATLSSDAGLTTPALAMTTTLSGRCHCGRVHATLAITCAASDCSPRACDCSFCRKHGAAWVSDPKGALRVEARDASDLRRYRQGSDTADMLLCAHCGVLVSVVFAHRDGLFGAINAGCLDDAALGAAVVVSPQRLSAAEKIERWRMLWARAAVSQPRSSQQCSPPLE